MRKPQAMQPRPNPDGHDMETRLKSAWSTLLLAIVLSGCGTVSTRTKGDAGPFHGVGYDMEKLSNASEWLELSGQGSAGNVPILWPRGILWVLDAPLSLLADTLLLPADSLRSRTAEHDVKSEIGQPDGPAHQRRRLQRYAPKDAES